MNLSFFKKTIIISGIIFIPVFLFALNELGNREKIIKIFPNNFTGDWTNLSATQFQDLGEDAPLANFNDSNSAYLNIFTTNNQENNQQANINTSQETNNNPLPITDSTQTTTPNSTDNNTTSTEISTEPTIEMPVNPPTSVENNNQNINTEINNEQTIQTPETNTESTNNSNNVPEQTSMITNKLFLAMEDNETNNNENITTDTTTVETLLPPPDITDPILFPQTTTTVETIFPPLTPPSTTTTTTETNSNQTSTIEFLSPTVTNTLEVDTTSTSTTTTIENEQNIIVNNIEPQETNQTPIKNYIELSNFSFNDNSSSSQRLDTLFLFLSFAGSGHEGDKLILQYKFENKWESLGEINLDGEKSNSQKGSYWKFPIPEFSNIEDLKKLQIRLQYQNNSTTTIALNSELKTSLFLDAAWLETTFQEELNLVNNNDFKITGETFFLPGAKPEFLVQIPEISLFEKIKELLKLNQNTEEKINKFYLIDEQGQEIKDKLEIKEVENGFNAIIDTNNYFAVGKYCFKLDVLFNDQSYTLSQSFYWGGLSAERSINISDGQDIFIIKNLNHNYELWLKEQTDESNSNWEKITDEYQIQSVLTYFEGKLIWLDQERTTLKIYDLLRKNLSAQNWETTNENYFFIEKQKIIINSINGNFQINKQENE